MLVGCEQILIKELSRLSKLHCLISSKPSSGTGTCSLVPLESGYDDPDDLPKYQTVICFQIS
jgi:hypothetical protein